jgi:sulfhydrogenase subunit alpha
MADETRTIAVDYLARVEGEGSLFIRMKDGVAEEVKLSIFEPPRFFEAFLRGRAANEAHDITSRICGICPIAYMMSACHAVEDALGLVVAEPVRQLRRLLYCGEWIESHALHVFLLHAPDFLGCHDVVEMSKGHREWVEKGLAIKKTGNALVTCIGGREIHPINVCLGGFYRAPDADDLEALLPDLARAQAYAEEALEWLASFDFPAIERDYELVALRHITDYPFCEGRIVSSHGLDIAVSEYDQHFAEQHAAHSTALQSTHDGAPYLTGPLARVHLNFDRLGEAARGAANAIGYGPPCRNPFKSLLARMIEVIQALDEAQRLIRAYEAPFRAPIPTVGEEVVGHGATEAPRGMLYHRYRIDPEGLILEARIVPPTSQNQLSIENDLRALAPELSRLPLEEATRLAEHAVRNHDPCISCATHFLKLRIDHV